MSKSIEGGALPKFDSLASLTARVEQLEQFALSKARNDTQGAAVGAYNSMVDYVRLAPPGSATRKMLNRQLKTLDRICHDLHAAFPHNHTPGTGERP